MAQELQALQVLERDMTLNLESLRELRSAAQYSRTFRGRIIDFGQRIFAIYCMIRVVSVSPNFFFLSSILIKLEKQKLVFFGINYSQSTMFSSNHHSLRRHSNHIQI